MTKWIDFSRFLLLFDGIPWMLERSVHAQTRTSARMLFLLMENAKKLTKTDFFFFFDEYNGSSRAK